MKTMISEVLAQARQRLVAAEFRPEPREARLLLAHVLGWTEAQVLAREDRVVELEALRRFELMLSRRLGGEPVAYILGSKEFYGREFRVDERVLVPRPETEHLVEIALDLPLPARASILDLGTGSGCVALTLALELPAARVVATDISLAALAVARENLRLHDSSRRVSLLAGDLAAALNLSRFDLIVSNPPYIATAEAESLSPEIVDFEPEAALFAGASGGHFHRRLLTELPDLTTGSWLAFEIGADQEERIRQLTAGSAFRLTGVRPDYAGHPRIAVLQRR